MKIMKLVKIAGLGIVLIVVLLIAVTVGFWALISYDLMSYTAMGSEILSPSGAPAGHALVAYDPAISGSAKNAAVKIAGDLQSKGYTVALAGVRSSTAGNVSGYDIVIIGGPTYGDMLGSSARSYLQNLNVSTKTKVGVYATGSVAPKNNDSAYMRKFVTSLPDGSYVKADSVVKLVTSDDGKVFVSDVDKQCSDFVSELLQ